MEFLTIYVMVAIGYFLGQSMPKNLSDLWHVTIVAIFWPIQLGMDLAQWDPNK